ncbi:MAG: hypothetical protein AAFQ67_09140, partial [Pseudomonadota bacterium]
SAVSAAALAASAIKTRPGTPAAVASAASPVASSRGQLDAGHLMLGGVGAAIAMLFALSVVYKAPRAKTVEASGPVGANAASADAAVCPAGYLPRSLFRTPPFEAGPVDPDR